MDNGFILFKYLPRAKKLADDCLFVGQDLIAREPDGYNVHGV